MTSLGIEKYVISQIYVTRVRAIEASISCTEQSFTANVKNHKIYALGLRVLFSCLKYFVASLGVPEYIYKKVSCCTVIDISKARQ